jgi:hypothetical protein
MKSIRTGMRCLVAAFLICASAHAAHADSVVYIFTGTDNSGAFPELEAFQLTVPDFIDPPTDGSDMDFTCIQLDSNTNCSSPGVMFSHQTGAFSAQVQFDAPIVGSVFAFPTGAFTTPGTYSSEVGGTTIGTLTVQGSPEPASIALTLGAGLLLFLSMRVKRLRRAFRTELRAFRSEPRA